jgi:transposase InsO family protein/transposase-like protein
MAKEVAAMDVRMAAALTAGTVSNVTSFCQEQGISRTTFYKWRERFAAEGLSGLQERSHRPRSCPGATPVEVEDAVVRVRKELADDGADNGPDSIRWALVGEFGDATPARSTIARILTRRGLVLAQPQKRPRSSMRRFVYARPNECWQSDWSHWVLADGCPVAIAATMDDHSRVLTAITAGLGDAGKSLTWSVMADSIGEYGIPVRSLTDNGWVYSGYRRGISVDFEINLRALGCHPICSSPYHPQTCGKIERHWQTLKKWLTAHGPHPTLEALNADLATYRDYYNHRRPHRALHGATPAQAYAATVTARPAQRPLPAPVTVTAALVSSSGCVGAGDYLINVGRAWTGHTLTAITDTNHITLLAGTQLVRVLDADPTRRYQPAPPERLHTYRHRELAQ